MAQPTQMEQPATTIPDLLGNPDIVQCCEAGNSRIREHVQSRSPRVFIISGPSGVGKDSVLEQLQRIHTSARYVVTATSRPMRDKEIDGVHYRFLEREDFERQVENGEFIEHALVYGNLYGVPRRPIEEGLASGQHVIVKVDVQGARTLRQRITNTISIFLLPESMEALLERLVDRKTDNVAAVMRRFKTATEEIEQIGTFDYVVFNEAGKLDKALVNIQGIIEAELHREHQPSVSIL